MRAVLRDGPTCERRDRDARKTARKGATEAWVTGTHAELRQTDALERGFSAASRRRDNTQYRTHATQVSIECEPGRGLVAGS
jgi:hypothetical protein